MIVSLVHQMVYGLPGVKVTIDKPSMVKIYHNDDVKRHVFEWVFTVTFEVRISNGQAIAKINCMTNVAFQG